MKEKNKKIIKLFLICFMIYFILGSFFSAYFKTTSQYNVFFGTDTKRVIEDLIIRTGNHYRTTVHPLFIILFQPIIRVLGCIINNKEVGIILLQSVLNAGSICLIYSALKRLKLDKKISLCLTLISAVSFSTLVFSMTVETYSFAQFFLILLFYYALIKKDEPLAKMDLIILSLLGVFSIGITITNYFVYCLVICFLTLLNKNMKKDKILYCSICLFAPVLLSVFLSELQNVIFPNSPLFFIENLKGFFSMSSEELTYIEPFGLNSILNQIKTVFANGFFAPTIIVGTDVYNMVLKIGSMPMLNKFMLAIILFVLVALFITFIKRNYKNIKDHKYFLLLFISFGFNFCLHTLYGNSEGILYTLHYQFLLILMVGYIINNLNYQKRNKLILFSLIIFLTFEVITNIYSVLIMYDKCNLLYGTIEKFPFLVILIVMMSIGLLILNLNIKNKNKVIATTILMTFFFVLYFITNNNTSQNIYFDEEYQKSLEKYTNQLETMKKKFNVKVAYNSNLNIYFFGMSNRNKILYKDGKLIDIKNNKVLKEYEIIKDMIIPNDYTVILKTKDNEIIKIYENEKGVYIEENNNITTITESDINLPEFEEYKYSEVLKVLHQEVLFNIDNTIPKPNLIVYENAWYRDAMMGAMVLNKTNNLSLIKPWVDNIKDIYDRQNGHEEADNLGELLYLISITNSKNNISKEILKEIEKIQKKNNTEYITGYVDGVVRSYYPTAILKYALNFANYSFQLNLPDFEDPYSSLVWYSKDQDLKNNNPISYIEFPYLGWASYHTLKKGDLYICDDIYPLSYEKDAAYANYEKLTEHLGYYNTIKLSPTHLWDASEKFLYLIEQD